MAGSKGHARCECEDGHDGHPVRDDAFKVDEPGRLRCTNVGRLRRLYRVDMEDRTGTAFCDLCANDAEESGLFSGRR